MKDFLKLRNISIFLDLKMIAVKNGIGGTDINSLIMNCIDIVERMEFHEQNIVPIDAHDSKSGSAYFSPVIHQNDDILH